MGRYLLAACCLAAVLLGVLAAVYVSGFGRHEADSDISRSRKTVNGLFTVSIEPESSTVWQGDLHAWLVTVKTASGKPVEYAAIDVSGGMPEHNHGLPTSPQVTGYLGNGHYRIEGMKFTMRGWWQLRLSISAAAGSDTVVFNLAL
ncbi:FixH family protein [Mesorhizobium sp. Root157]|uniref:FixH family protein n=1 Tax=Mesorhizobium sp. Root157 TaxID=1736477 RepID=UPI002A4E2921|nr:FixH family protein [Mesorhizobium sp. Root157]